MGSRLYTALNFKRLLIFDHSTVRSFSDANRRFLIKGTVTPFFFAFAVVKPSSFGLLGVNCLRGLVLRKEGLMRYCPIGKKKEKKESGIK